MQNHAEIAAAIRHKAQSLGLSGCVTLPVTSLTEESEYYSGWLQNGFHGEMDYMARNIDKRLDPRLLVENAKTVIVVLQNYFTHKKQTDSTAPVLSKYAYGTDYHFVLKDKLKALLQFIQTEISSCGGRVFTDSAPVLERAWAKRAGLGWIGKNSNLISPDMGSFFFIGELIIDIELPYDNPRPVADHCGKCNRCIDACPTKAIVASRVVDARKCISYQTIEVKGELDAYLKGKFDNRVFGCDICQDVCPWNLKSESHSEPAFQPHEKLLTLSTNEWHNLDESLFSELFKKSAVKRTGFKGLKRNLRFIDSTGHE
jgi:epoxyqueuosine reductase